MTSRTDHVSRTAPGRRRSPASPPQEARRENAQATSTPTAGAAGDRRTWWLAAAAAFVVGLVAYGNTLGHGFVWDDTIWLDQKLRFYRGPLDAFFEPEFMPMRQVYRPLSQLTYWIDQSLWWRNPFGFHLTSVVLHALNGALLVWLARALGFRPVAALTASVLFLVHPIQPESVAWLTNRVDVLTTTFVLLALLAATRPVSVTALALVAVASFLAAAAKETGCVVPLLVASAVAWLPAPAPASTRSRWLLPLASLVGILPYFALRPAVAGTGIPLGSLGLDAVGRLVGSFGYQVERLLAPVGFAPYFATVPMDAATLAWAAAGFVAIAAGFLLPDADGRRRFALGWVGIAAALPVLVVLADFTSTPVAEHRLYLAVVGLGLLVAVAVERFALDTSATGRLAVGAVLLGLFAVTMQRNGYWRDELTLWGAVVARVDDEPVPHMNFGLALAAAGRTAEAETAYRRALALDPPEITQQRTSINLGLLLVERGLLDEAEGLFTRANAIGKHAIAYRGLGLIARRRGQAALQSSDRATAERELGRAVAFLNDALAINPRYPQAYMTLAGVLYDAGQFRAALENYRRAAAIAGDDALGRDATQNADALAAWLAAHPEAQ